jgi:hypothetical protein
MPPDTDPFIVGKYAPPSFYSISSSCNYSRLPPPNAAIFPLAFILKLILLIIIKLLFIKP